MSLIRNFLVRIKFAKTTEELAQYTCKMNDDGLRPEITRLPNLWIVRGFGSREALDAEKKGAFLWPTL